MNPKLVAKHIAFGGEAVGVIPARCASSRFPDKPLALISGIPMICWTHHNSSHSASLREVFVAAEDSEIIDAVLRFDGKAILVQGRFQSGSDRIAEAVRDMQAPVIVNIQADEPLIDPQIIDKALLLLEEHPEFGVTTIVRPLSDYDEYLDPNNVKAVLDSDGKCLYFSRAPIPARHGKEAVHNLEMDLPYYLHVGIYCFRKEALMEFAELPPSALEQAEGLEQLRYLENGGFIGAVIVEKAGPGINTEADIQLAEKYISDNNIKFA